MEGATFPEPIPLHALNPFCPKEYQSKAFTKKSLGAQAAIGRRIKFPKNTSNCKSNTPVKHTHTHTHTHTLAPYPTENVRVREIKPFLYPTTISLKAIIWEKFGWKVERCEGEGD